MQENTATRKQTQLRNRSLQAAGLLLMFHALTGCSEQATTSGTPSADDSAAAYAALSASLERCDSDYDQCVAMAGENMGAIDKCQVAADKCNKDTQGMEDQAESMLERETHHCRKVCSDNDAGGFDDADAGSGDMHHCMSRHAPKVPKCLAGLFGCLDEAGIFERDASGKEIRACLREAHGCIKDELAAHRAERRERHKNRNGRADTAPTQNTAGSTSLQSSTIDAAGSGGSGGSSDDKHGHRRPFWKR